SMARSPFQESDRRPLIGILAAAGQLIARRQGPQFLARLYREINPTDRCLNAIAAPIAAIQARQFSEDSADLSAHTPKNDTSEGGERLTRQEISLRREAKSRKAAVSAAPTRPRSISVPSRSHPKATSASISADPRGAG